ncbi:MAG: HsdR family type I site-specific deoxyribonuclease, partial [Acidobacteria bacterium]|nr:HsdR family type I site-specific deoxyribonuclease [Acidobacteriota bacterium]
RQYRGGYQFAGLVDRARELRKKETTAEALLWELLRNRQLLGFKFRRQHQYGDYIADFFCHLAQLVIECDGLAHEANEAWHHDQTRDAYLIAHGLRVLRFTNDRIVNDTENVLVEISSYLPMLHTLSPTSLPEGEGPTSDTIDLPSPSGRGVGGEGLKPDTGSVNLLPSPSGRGVGGEGAKLEGAEHGAERHGGAESSKHGGAQHGRLGVFWHTQGSGKSYSMVFFSQKILRKLPGNWTFLIVTDREDLNDQIYKNFAGTGAVTEPENQVRANSGEHLKQLLQEDHRHVFTLVQKFRTPQASPSPQPSPSGRGSQGVYPKLSDRSNIIVITDEAHRSQYDQLALNMRNALPNAAFIAFTGTPLMAGEERTKEVFGDYISVYNFRQSVDDHATVPLFYENRIPALQLVNEALNEDMARVIEEAELTEEQEEKLEREFAREYQLITRDDRLEKVAEDIVRHFAGRGFQGKAMVISLDKATAVRMFDKVHKYWHKHLRELESKLSTFTEDERVELEDKIAFMRKTDMAVVVSQSQNEVEDLAAKGANIVPHRRRMLKEDLDTKFKDPSDPLRLVFVCAMWITGFDVPSCSTIYLDKPMRNHTLMQTIARANRVFRNKVNGLIVDYVGVFRNLQRALAIYGAGGGIRPGETPVKDKQDLVELLRGAIQTAEDFCAERWVDLPSIRDAAGFTRVKLLDDAVEAIVENDESKEQYRSLTNNVTRLYKAILPDPLANEFGQINLLLSTIQDKIQALAPVPDISDVLSRVETLLDASIASEGYVIHETDRIVDLSKIDFDALQKQFASGRKHTEVERLRNLLSAKLAEMVSLNRTRMDYLEHFQEMINEYNSGAVNVEIMFERLVKFTKELNAEEQRHIAEQ